MSLIDEIGDWTLESELILTQPPRAKHRWRSWTNSDMLMRRRVSLRRSLEGRTWISLIFRSLLIGSCRFSLFVLFAVFEFVRAFPCQSKLRFKSKYRLRSFAQLI